MNSFGQKSISNDTLTNVYKRKKVVSFLKKVDSLHHGSIKFDYRYTSKPFQFQNFNPNYLRVDLTNSVQLFGIPLNNTINVTTEQSRLNYNLGRFNLNFDKKDLEKNLTKKLNHHILGKFAERDSLLNSFSKDKLLSKALSDSLSKYNRTLDSNINIDSSQILFYSQKRDSLKKVKQSLEEKFDRLDTLLKSGRLDTLHGIYQKAGSLDLRSAKEILNLNSLQSLFLNIENLQLGNVILKEDNLAIRSPLLYGGSAQYSKKGMFVSLTSGSLLLGNAFNNIVGEITKAKTTIVSAGYEGKRNAFKYSFMNTNQGDISTITLNSYSKNVVHHLQNEIQLNENIKGRAEYSWSKTSKNSTYTVEEQQYNVDPFSILSSPNIAYSIGVVGKVKRTKTKYEAEISRVGSDYFSATNRFQRNNWKTYTVKLKQYFLKKKIQLKYTSQLNTDNILNNSRYTSIISRQKIETKLKYNSKLPILNLSYQLNEQYSLVEKTHTRLSKNTILGASLTYSHLFKNEMVYNAILSSHHTSVFIHNFNSGSVTINNTSLAQIIVLNPKIDINSNIVFISQRGVLESKSTNSSIGFNYRYKGISSFGLSIVTNINSAVGNLYGLSLQGKHAFKWGILFGYNINLNHFEFQNTGLSYNQNFSNLSLIKTF